MRARASSQHTGGNGGYVVRAQASAQEKDEQRLAKWDREEMNQQHASDRRGTTQPPTTPSTARHQTGQFHPSRPRWPVASSVVLLGGAGLGGAGLRAQTRALRVAAHCGSAKAAHCGSAKAEVCPGVVQVFLRADQGIHAQVLPRMMLISGVKRLMLAFRGESVRANAGESHADIEVAVGRMWNCCYLVCQSQVLREESTLKASNVGDGMTIHLMVYQPTYHHVHSFLLTHYPICS